MTEPADALVITESAPALAASRCLLARILDPERWITARHPSRCGWCDFPREVLTATADRFNQLMDYDRKNRTHVTDAEAFNHLKPDERERLIVEAQALEEGPPPAPAHLAELAVAAATPAPEPAPKRSRRRAVPADPPPPAAVPDWFGGPA